MYAKVVLNVLSIKKMNSIYRLKRYICLQTNHTKSGFYLYYKSHNKNSENKKKIKQT